MFSEKVVKMHAYIMKEFGTGNLAKTRDEIESDIVEANQILQQAGLKLVLDGVRLYLLRKWEKISHFMISS